MATHSFFFRFVALLLIACLAAEPAAAVAAHLRPQTSNFKNQTLVEVKDLRSEVSSQALIPLLALFFIHAISHKPAVWVIQADRLASINSPHHFIDEGPPIDPPIDPEDILHALYEKIPVGTPLEQTVAIIKGD